MKVTLFHLMLFFISFEVCSQNTFTYFDTTRCTICEIIIYSIDKPSRVYRKKTHDPYRTGNKEVIEYLVSANDLISIDCNTPLKYDTEIKTGSFGLRGPTSLGKLFMPTKTSVLFRLSECTCNNIRNKNTDYSIDKFFVLLYVNLNCSNLFIKRETINVIGFTFRLKKSVDLCIED